MTRLALLALVAVAVVGCVGSTASRARTKVHPHPALVHLPQPAPADMILATYAFVGCNRISASDAQNDPLANGSTANVPQLKQTLADLSNPTLVGPKPNLFFFLGDIVDNEATDQGQTLSSQLTAWATAFKALVPVPMVAVPGNHELLQQTGSDEDSEFPNPPTQAIWLDWVTSNGYASFAGNGPTPATSPGDQLMFDDSKMSYSFDVGLNLSIGFRKIHFVVVNTDTMNTVTSALNANYKTAAWIPLDWIKADVTAASADPEVGAIVLLGHRPITVPAIADENPIDPALGAQLAQFLASVPKFAFYACAHAHLWSPQDAAGTGVLQIVGGNGGSKLESNWFDGTPPPPEWQAMGAPYFGFSVITVHQSGAIGLYHVWRPANPDHKKYYLPGPTMTSQATQEVVLYTMQ